AFWAPKPSVLPLVEKGAERAIGVVAAQGRRWHVIEYPYVEPPVHSLRRIRAERESPYHHMAIVDNAVICSDVLGPAAFRGDQVRLADGTWVAVNPRPSLRQGKRGNHRDLKFDQYTESSVMLDETAEHIREPYTSGTTYSTLLHLPFVFKSDIRRVLIVGGGGGIVPVIFRKHYGDRGLSIDVVEIDPEVVRVAKEFFGLVEDDQLRVHVQDGRMFVHNSEETYDLIILDAYTAGGRIPFHLTTREFLTECRNHVTDDGVVLMNVISALDGRKSDLFRAEYKTFNEVFGRERVYVFPKDGERDAFNRSQNVMLIANGRSQERRLSKGEIGRRAARAVRTGRIRLEAVAGYAREMVSRADLDGLSLQDVPVLTDNYAPVDFMVVTLEE
ncbi:MAG: fused MFS/spermidine synthase, partial [Planctomycetota bacterium]